MEKYRKIMKQEKEKGQKKNIFGVIKNDESQLKRIQEVEN